MLAVALVAVLAILFDVGRGHFGCFGENTSCARSTEKEELYRGVLRNPDGSLYRSREFAVHFRSGATVDFHTNVRGRYCFLWASEALVAFPATPDGRQLDTEPESGAIFPGLYASGLLEGRQPPPGCEEGGTIPWDRSETATSTWQYKLLLRLPMVALLFLAGAIALRRRAIAFPLLWIGTALVVASAVLAAVL